MDQRLSILLNVITQQPTGSCIFLPNFEFEFIFLPFDIRIKVAVSYKIKHEFTVKHLR